MCNLRVCNIMTKDELYMCNMMNKQIKGFTTSSDPLFVDVIYIPAV